LDGAGFKLAHAHALSIAVAVVTARQQGLMFPADPRATTRPIEIELDLFADAAFGVVGKEPASQCVGFDVLLVDQPAVYRIEKLPGLIRVSRKTGQQHLSASTLLVTATPVIRAIARGELSVAMAIEFGVLELESEATCHSSVVSAACLR
ncbi:MAG: hypothetical protein GY826_01655, partial [Fuerstiella sp.]|nr:hypothetical protein [Fuerstiella sp.]